MMAILQYVLIIIIKKSIICHKKILYGPKPEPGEALKWYSPGKFYVDYTAILAEENKIEGYLSECTIAK